MSQQNAEPPSRSKIRSFLDRSLSTVIIWAILAIAFWIGKPVILIAIFSGMALMALVEYFRLFPIMGFRRFRWQTYGVSVAYLILLFSPMFGFNPAWLAELDGLAVALLVTLVVLRRLQSPLEGFRTLDEIAATIFGFIYCILLFSFVAKVLMLPLTDVDGNPSSQFYILYLIAVTKFTDLGAYAIGSLFGRDKMIPHISPGKTWQGFAGAILISFVTSFVCYFLFGSKIPIITPLHAAILAVLLSLVAVLGDLAESILKRSLEAKDSGQLMPGIGGFLDLIDSVIFTAPLFYIYLLIFS